MRHNVHIACADCDQSAWRLSPKSDAGIHEAATAMSGAAQVGECRARALESGALDSWLSRERLLCGADFRSLKFRSWPADGLASTSGFVKDCPTPARMCTAVQAPHSLRGGRWIILKGGNREGVLRWSAVARGYGDLSARGAE